MNSASEKNKGIFALVLFHFTAYPDNIAEADKVKNLKKRIKGTHEQVILYFNPEQAARHEPTLQKIKLKINTDKKKYSVTVNKIEILKIVKNEINFKNSI